MKQLVAVLVTSVLIVNCSSKSSESDTTTDSIEQISSRSKSDDGPWQILNVKDEFGDVIKGESTIAADFGGKMANSATADADLTVRMQVQDSTILSAFYEYNREPQTKLPENTFINIRIKLANGELKTIQQFLYQNYMVDGDKKELFKLMTTETRPFKVLVDWSTVSKYQSTIYNFEIDPAGFNEIIKSSRR